MGIGDEEDEGDKGIFPITHYQLPITNAQFPMPHAQFPIPPTYLH